MLLTDARRPARIDTRGALVRLGHQDRTVSDRTLIIEGHSIVRACLRREMSGPYQLQAAIAAVHDDATTAYERAIELCTNGAELDHLSRRRRELRR